MKTSLYEKIQSMSKDELAEFLDRLTESCQGMDCNSCPLFLGDEDIHCTRESITEALGEMRC